MKNLIILSLICTTLISCSSNKKNKTTAQKKAKLYFDEGTNNLYSGSYTEALKNLLESYKYQPNDSKLLNNLGMAYFFKESPTQAKKFIKLSLKKDPKNSDARMNLASIYMKEKDYDSAHEQYILITRDLVFEKQYKTYHNLAKLELKRKNTTQALAYLKKSIEINDNYCPGYYELGKMQFDMGQYKKAQKNFKEASMGLCYKSPEPRFFRAKSFVKLNQYFEATQILEEMTETFAMTKWESIARRGLNKIKKIHNKEALDTIEAKNTKIDVSTPNF